MIVIWHWLVHASGSDYGAPYGRFIPYSFWSGVAGSFLVTICQWLLIVLPIWYFHHTCHDHLLCLRWGSYEAAGGMFRYCYKHHPDFAHLNGRKPTREDKHRLHREWKQAQQR